MAERVDNPTPNQVFLCPKCSAKYESGVDICPACGVALTENRPGEAGNHEHGSREDRQWELLYLATSRPAAEFLNETLRTAGVASVVKYRGRFFGRGASFGLGAVTAAVDAEVWVDKEDLDQAREIRRQTVGDQNTAHGYLPEK